MKTIEETLINTFTEFLNPVEIIRIGNEKFIQAFGKMIPSHLPFSIGENGEYIYGNNEYIFSDPEEIKLLDSFYDIPIPDFKYERDTNVR